MTHVVMLFDKGVQRVSALPEEYTALIYRTIFFENIKKSAVLVPCLEANRSKIIAISTLKVADKER